MRPSSLRRLSLALVAIGFLTLTAAPAVHASPLSHGFDSASWLSWMWDRVSFLWDKEGVDMDPDGRSNTHNLVGVDPAGRAASHDKAGPTMDPDGRTVHSNAGPDMDPNGHA